MTSSMPVEHTVLGKWAIDRWWSTVQPEENVYWILHPVQSSAVPIFLSTIDIDWIYFTEVSV